MPKPKLDYDWIAARLEALRVDQGGGSFGFSVFGRGFTYDDLITLLETHQEFDSEISESERRRLIRHAVQLAAKEGPLVGKALQAQLRKQNNLFLKQPKTDHVLVSSLTIRRPPKLRRLAFDGARF